MTTHPALDAEQETLDRAYAILGDDVPADQPLIFGRVDDGAGSRYVGRHQISDASGHATVVAWHTPDAGSFYEACATDLGGVRLKRIVTVSGRQVIALHDEIADGAPLDITSTTANRPVVGKVVVAALEQFRASTIGEATATLRPEQYRIVRALADGVLVIQGGPGTGKTITALHRAAWLAANDDRVRAAGLLVVTPTATLRDYVADVLPCLGADAVHADVASLYTGDADLRGRETSTEASRVKGSAVMAVVLRRLVESQQDPSTPEDLLRALLGDPALLDRLGDDLLKAGQQDALHREPAASAAEPWTVDDLILLDELSHLLGRPAPSYGHAVVDEAQNLSPMQARAIARRCRSVTLVGDLGFATGAGRHDSWSELTSYFASGSREMTLTLGYRVPRPVVELSRRQLPDGASALTVPQSLRDGLGNPLVRRVDPDDVVPIALAAGEAAAGTGFKVGVIVAADRFDDTLRYCSEAGIKVGDGRNGDMTSPVTVLPADMTNGLEFDAIALVEPAEIADGTELGRRLLYVAMTRCTQSLAIFHSQPLPAGLEHLDRPGPPSREPEIEHRPKPAGTDDLFELFKLLQDDDRMLVEVMIRRLLRDSLERDV